LNIIVQEKNRRQMHVLRMMFAPLLKLLAMRLVQRSLVFACACKSVAISPWPKPLFAIYVDAFHFVNQHEKIFVTYLGEQMLLFVLNCSFLIFG